MKRLENALKNLDNLGDLKKKYQPLTHLVTVLFKAITSLSRIQHEYRFSIHYFLTLFEMALCKIIPSAEVAVNPEVPNPEEEDNTLTNDVVIEVVDKEGRAVERKWNNGEILSFVHLLEIVLSQCLDFGLIQCSLTIKKID